MRFVSVIQGPCIVSVAEQEMLDWSCLELNLQRPIVLEETELAGCCLKDCHGSPWCEWPEGAQGTDVVLRLRGGIDSCLLPVNRLKGPPGGRGAESVLLGGIGDEEFRRSNMSSVDADETVAA